MNQGTATKLFAISSMVSSAVWFGNSIAVQALANSAFQPATSVLKDQSADVLSAIMLHCGMLSMISVLSYSILSISFIGYCLSQRSRFKTDAYLVLALFLTCIALLPGLYFMWKSWQFAQVAMTISAGNASDYAGSRELFILLFTRLAWPNLLSLATYLTVVFVLILQPLKKRPVT